MTPWQRHTRRHRIRQLAKEIHNTAACLKASQTAICQKTGLNTKRWRALAVIDRSSYTLSISDLARQLRRSRQSVHPLALSLEKAGWIRFLPNRDDRRLLQMELTPCGKAVLTAAEGTYNAWLLTMAFDLEDRELSALLDTLRAVRDRIARARDYA
jgi:DNA-binding MarR family transcriptional regulator